MEHDLNALTTLAVGGSGITDAAIAALIALPITLENISLWHTKVSESGCSELRAATGLSMDDSMRSTRGTYILVP